MEANQLATHSGTQLGDALGDGLGVVQAPSPRDVQPADTATMKNTPRRQGFSLITGSEARPAGMSLRGRG